ncbi:hypothetical protein DDZ14_14960 [Maritimibacter sp. 55A14]|uniref:hypothetical protein n=1 Tax=Maritimibacter sp. 55A14 TaxID=2174844 RepID=UPI000D6104CE|nr:hypothetical protein [Maritimibacter sp. 55A14]PWE30585.1 hypothetical protein DDZ14_14960 [Maritimibacter sp. 55A14]
MMEFERLPDDHPALAHSPLLRAARLTLGYALDHGEIGLTARKAFKRSFVHWAVDAFDWPGFGAAEAFRYNKVLNEHEFVPLQVVHFLLLERRLGRHYKGGFRPTAKGRILAASPAGLFAELIPFFILEVDHASYGRFDEHPCGNWEIWLNVLNVKTEDGATEKELYGAFYGEGPDWDNDGWREMATFCQCVIKPLKWAGLVTVQDADGDGPFARMCTKTPLWRAALRLETDEMVQPAMRH